MESELAAVPLYRFVDEGRQNELFTAFDIEGFFVDSVHSESNLAVIVGASPLGRTAKLPKLFEDVEIHVLDSVGDLIGRYYVGRFEVREIWSGKSVAGGADLSVSLFGNTYPYPMAREIWRRWSVALPRDTGEWARYPPKFHGDWMHVARKAWFTAGREAKRYGDMIDEINGENLSNMDSFYCAIGEAANGPGGYFGANLDALEDCLINSEVQIRPFRIPWRDFDTSLENIGEKDLMAAVSILQEYGVEIEY